MKTYSAFRSIGMTQSEAIFCSCIHLARKEGKKIDAKDESKWDELRGKYREFWSNLIGRI